jgi:hypothetical protein
LLIEPDLRKRRSRSSALLHLTGVLVHDRIPTANDTAFDALHAAGWSVGDVGGPDGWIVSGHRGEQTIEAHGPTQKKAWAAALEQAEAMPTVIVELKGSKHRSPGI